MLIAAGCAASAAGRAESEKVGYAGGIHRRGGDGCWSLGSLMDVEEMDIKGLGGEIALNSGWTSQTSYSTTGGFIGERKSH